MSNDIEEQLWQTYDVIIGAWHQIRFQMKRGRDELAEQRMINGMNQLEQLAKIEPTLKYLIYDADKVKQTFDTYTIRYIVEQIEQILGITGEL